MNAGQILRASEKSALRGGEFLTHVTGKVPSKKSKSLGSVGFVVAMIVIFMMFFGSGNLITKAFTSPRWHKH